MRHSVTLGLVHIAMGHEREANMEHAFALARRARGQGAELIVYPSAIGTLSGDPYDDAVDIWRVAMRGHAVCNALYVAAVNRVGDEDGMTFYGHSFVVQPDGRAVAEAGGDEDVLLSRLDAERIARTRTPSLFYRDRRPETYGGILSGVLADGVAAPDGGAHAADRGLSPRGADVGDELPAADESSAHRDPRS